MRASLKKIDSETKKGSSNSAYDSLPPAEDDDEGISNGRSNYHNFRK